MVIAPLGVGLELEQDLFHFIIILGFFEVQFGLKRFFGNHASPIDIEDFPRCDLINNFLVNRGGRITVFRVVIIILILAILIFRAQVVTLLARLDRFLNKYLTAAHLRTDIVDISLAHIDAALLTHFDEWHDAAHVVRLAIVHHLTVIEHDVAVVQVHLGGN